MCVDDDRTSEVLHLSTTNHPNTAASTSLRRPPSECACTPVLNNWGMKYFTAGAHETAVNNISPHSSLARKYCDNLSPGFIVWSQNEERTVTLTSESSQNKRAAWHYILCSHDIEAACDANTTSFAFQTFRQTIAHRESEITVFPVCFISPSSSCFRYRVCVNFPGSNLICMLFCYTLFGIVSL